MRTTATGRATDPVRILLVGEQPWLDRTRAALAESGGRLEPVAASSLEDAVDELAAAVDEPAAAVDEPAAAVDEPAAAVDEPGVASSPFHAVVAAGSAGGEDGVALLDRVGAVAPDLPVVVHPEEGSERLASAAFERGAADYVPATDRDRLGERLLAAVDAGERRRRERRLAARFEAAFDAADRYAWVLDPEGAVVGANHRALELLDAVPGSTGGGDARGSTGGGDAPGSIEGGATSGSVEGGDAPGSIERQPFVESPWCAGDVAPRVEAAIADAAGGEEVRVDVDGLLPGDGERVGEVTVRPVRDGTGRPAELLVEAEDAATRARREAELRRSERLHRITLNNMTDTVLVTDDEGAFVYVCPNVHFIFGYSAEEVHELGTIDELLGEEPFDPGRLSSEGVLTNVECTTTDESGEERTLLVNVKEVSIEGGTRLYSCRDVTKRKERERALTTLHGTARELLYAETDREIGRTLVADATAALGADGAAFYRFDEREGMLRPIAVTEGAESLHGPLPELAPDGNSIVGRTFIEGEPATFADVRDAERLTNPATGFRGCIHVPTGEHGVLVVGSEAVDAFDPIATEVAALVAATAEAALDRVERMAELRRRDRELQRRNERLAEINRVNDLIREVDRALVRAETREEIEHAVCERLTSAGRFGLAWIGAVDGDGVDLRAAAGTGREYIDAIREGLVDGTEPVADGTEPVADGTEPVAVAARTGEPAVVGNVAGELDEAPWRREALARGFQSAIAVPLAYEGVSYGTLAVYATGSEAFDEVTRDVLVELGETVASAIGSRKRKEALLDRSRTELEYETDDDACLPHAVARRAGCSITLEGGVEQVEDGVLAFATVEDAPAERVAAIAREFAAVEGATAVDGSDDGGTVRLRLSSPFVATALADHGIVLRHLAADPESARLVLDVPASIDTRTADRILGTVYDDRAMLAQRERTRPLGAERLRSELLDGLTDRQLEVARTAYHSGYYGEPRDSSGEEVAAALDVSPATFYQTNKRIQGRLFSLLFDGG